MDLEAYVRALKHVCEHYLGERDEVSEEDKSILVNMAGCKMAHATLRRIYPFMRV